MTIYTTAAMVAAFNVCDGGTERTAAALAREGKTMETRVTMQNILRSLGLSDTVFSFCAVEKGCEAERDIVLGKYMKTVAGRASTLILLTKPGLGSLLADANKCINKRADGILRREMMRRMTVAVLRARQAEQNPALRYWLAAYSELLSFKPDHLAATHATVAFVEGCKVVGIGQEAIAELTKDLADLLGVDPTYNGDQTNEGRSQ